MVIRALYKGKKVLITGATGFIGKVVLEKILRDIPEVGGVYIIVRTNNDTTAKDRFEDDVIPSRVFDVLRSQRSDFLPFITSKIIPVAGDLSQPNLGLSPEDMDFLVKNIDIVIHLAASIDFRERLDKAVENNVLGTQRLFTLAKRFHRLQAFVHCSTAYVNCNKYGRIEEKLAMFDFDPEDMIETIMKCETSKIEKLTKTLLYKYKYPNTYTFTKAIAENLIMRKRDGVPMIFFRPSIVGASFKEPVPGWIDSVAAAAAPVLYLGVGLVRFMKGNPRVVADIVPVDQVANALLSCAAVIEGRDALEIVHCGTSHRNPEIWHNWAFWAEEYWKKHVPKKAISPNPNFMFHTNRLIYNTHFFLSYTAPSTLYSMFAALFGSARQRRDAERFKKMTKAADMISDTFEHFTTNEWIFEVTNLEKLFNERLTEEDRKIFSVDFTLINWQQYLYFFCHGLHKYVLKEEGVTPPTDLLSTNIITNHDKHSSRNYIHWIFADISWAYSEYRNVLQLPVLPQTSFHIKTRVMESDNVKAAMTRVMFEQKLTAAAVEKRASYVYDRLASNMKQSTIRFMAWFLKKVWRRIYQGVHVDEKGIEKLRVAMSKAPVVLVPTHRSYVDFLIISYVFFEYDLPMPRIAAGEDFLSIILVRWILRNCGAFFLRRSFDGDVLYWSMFTEYVEILIKDHLPVEFFIEGKRSRSGKALYPKIGVLNMVCNPYFNQDVPDLSIVPISFSYEKVLEGELYTQEMMGESKTRESLNGLLRASKVLRMNFGSINIVFGELISLKEYTADFQPPPSLQAVKFDPIGNQDHRKELMHHLGYTIIHTLNKNIVITATSIISTVLLTYRRGISREELILKSDWLRSEITARGAAVAFEGPTDTMVDYALKLLSNLITKRRHMYEPGKADAQSQKGAFGNPNFNYRKNILVLSFYRNQLLHLFQWDGIIGCVMAGLCGIKNGKKYKKNDGSTCVCVGAVDSKTLIEEASFIASLFSIEFVNTPDQNVQHNVTQALDRLIEREFICSDTTGPDPGYTHTPSHLSMQTYYKITPRGEGRLTFLCHMFWPFVESYLVGCLTLFTITSDGIKPNLLQQRMSWLAEKMYDEGKLNFFESCNMDVLQNTVHIFLEMGILTKKKMVDILDQDLRKRGNKGQGSAGKGTPLLEKKDDEVLVLSAIYNSKNGPLQDLAKRIGKYRKTPPISKIKTNDLTRAIVEDFPMVAKL